MRNYETKRTFLSIDAPEKSSKRSLRSSLIGVSTIVQSKELKERLKLASQSAQRLPSLQV
jgi:hypothetical protein